MSVNMFVYKPAKMQSILLSYSRVRILTIISHIESVSVNFCKLHLCMMKLSKEIHI